MFCHPLKARKLGIHQDSLWPQLEREEAKSTASSSKNEVYQEPHPATRSIAFHAAAPESLNRLSRAIPDKALATNPLPDQERGGVAPEPPGNLPGRIRTTSRFPVRLTYNLRTSVILGRVNLSQFRKRPGCSALGRFINGGVRLGNSFRFVTD